MNVYRSLKNLIANSSIHKSNINKSYLLYSHSHKKNNSSFKWICRRYLWRCFAHVIANFIATTLDSHLKSTALGIVIGGLPPLIAVSIMERDIKKGRYHIVAGDHEGNKKDLDGQHH